MVETTSAQLYNPHAVVICQYCKGDFAQNHLANHERVCAKKTIEEREKTRVARDNYRKYYSVAANGTGSTARKPVATSEHVDVKEQQHQRKLERQRTYYAKYGHAGKRGTAAQLAKAVSKASSIMMNGKRVQITLSLDWDTVRRMLVTLGPDIAIDKIELV